MTRDQAQALARQHLHAATGLTVDPLPWVVDAVMEAAATTAIAPPAESAREPQRGDKEPDWPTESRIDVIGSNGNDGLAYGVRDAGPAAFEGRTTRREDE